ncbi:DUF559 domain-containing protein [Eggerthella sp. NSJ-70]|uniref:DUF559 domain-containing protein n=1 Tax=Eggerthella hominis TaxID=2763043 RepID=A0ABR7BVX6_9ACTN|nr:DUF559 domain-containing protein [Eggerthella hominis]
MIAPTICFGRETALQILRTTGPGARAYLRADASMLPDRAPSPRELERAIELVRTSYPSVAIDLPAHVLVASSSRRRMSQACKSHVCASALQGRSLHRLGKGVFASAAALAFVHIAAQEKSEVALLELGYELCGSYQTRRTGVASAYQVEPLASVKVFENFATRNPSLRGSGKVASIARYLADDSASPRETKQALAFGLPMMYGGHGLGIPRMNYKILASPAARALTGKTYFRGDLCWPEAKLDVEYQSKESHSGEKKRISDSRRTNALVSMGWTVVCVTNDELDSMVATDAIAETIRRHLGKRLQVRVSGYHARKLKLRRQLGLPIGYD